MRHQVVTFTGAMTIDGDRMYRADAEKAVRKAGGVTTTDFSGRITLLVEGDLDGKTVTDPGRGYSQKLVGAQNARVRGWPHVHVIDTNGFADLLDGTPARCRNLRGSGTVVRVAPEVGEGVLGGRLLPHNVGTHDTTALRGDLSALDAATAAHEETVRRLIEHLLAADIIAVGPARGSPRFDIGWARGDAVFIGEVKSLRSTNEDQQIRLGIGQLLDYAQQVRANRLKVTPVLVLERKPTDARWDSLADAHGFVLTHGPDFPGV